MAGTATHLHTVPTPMPTRVSASAPVGLRRGNHPAGRALRPAGAPGVPGAVLPDRSAPRSLAEVVPLRPRRQGGGCADASGRGGLGGTTVRPVPAAARAGSAGPVRLTRRGRRVVAGLGMGAVVALSVVVGGAVLGDAGSPALELAGHTTVTVHSGDTLWSIAVALAPDADPRDTVDALQEANGLTGASLVPGQVLLVP